MPILSSARPLAARPLATGCALAIVSLVLSGCGGMTNAVTVLPNTLDGLAAQGSGGGGAEGREPLPEGCERRPCRGSGAR
ncbi:hypothetical protein DYI37_15265 [Fulvimarina endophytica]|uniref:Uncharacterized protein n=1 Tax=Fulvimarina endophytica TaxID=2293836 RepID=A0A371X039_9HYPH|nr:hypothetical protein [Fulvimarina endophytica]RFC62598.1 hypothetical protein DYI37_15265 [Fulvimarina endophytica]